MAEAGILTPNDHVELIGGDIVDMTPIGSAHAGKTNRLNRLFARAAADGLALVSVQGPLRLDAWNEPLPDLMLLRPRDDDYQDRHPGAADVLLLVELSDSSLAHDRGTKLALCARFGVPEVWIVDLRGAAVEVYRQPENGLYMQTRSVCADGMLDVAMVPGNAFPAKDLLRRAAPPLGGAL